MEKHQCSVLFLSAMLVLATAKSVPQQDSEDKNARLLGLNLNAGLSAGLGGGLGIGGMGGFGYAPAPEYEYQQMEYPRGDYGYAEVSQQSVPQGVVNSAAPPNQKAPPPSNTVPIKDQYICFPVSFITSLFPFGAMGKTDGGSNQAELQLGLASSQFPNFFQNEAPCVDQEDPELYGPQQVIQQPLMQYPDAGTYDSGPYMSYPAPVAEVKKPGLLTGLFNTILGPSEKSNGGGLFGNSNGGGLFGNSNGGGLFGKK